MHSIVSLKVCKKPSILLKEKKVEAKIHRAPEVNVVEIRRNLGLTQMEFASKLCISVSTLRHWERGDRNPQGPALALLNVVAKEPKAVMRALG